jgi:hypothetical protein
MKAGWDDWVWVDMDIKGGREVEGDREPNIKSFRSVKLFCSKTSQETSRQYLST